MSRKSYPNVNAANQYARDVVRGKIVACQFVIQACQRHLDDLMAEKSKSFRYRFDKDQAERAAKFIQLLPHTKGEWAFKRMPITLEPWQLFVICCAFGWVNKGTRLRRFREVYTEIPRKNGKSAISAGVALYCFACDNEFGVEVYSGATTEKQAWEVFRPARLMCKRTPMLTEAFGIEVNASNMNRPEDGARFEPLIGNPGDGSSPHCAVVDEYHEHATDALYTTMLTRAWTYRHWMGTGTVGVMIASSDLINPIPEESTETAARQHIGPLAPVAGSDLYVFRPVAHTVDFHIRVTPDTPEIRAAITAELRSFLLRDGYPQGELKVSRISEAISGANGEYSHQLLAPVDNISIAKNELAVLGTISWT